MTPKVRTVDIPRSGSGSSYFASATITASGDLVHISGQSGISRHGHLPADYESQIHLALLNLHRILVAAKTSVSNILKFTLYIVDYDPAKRKHARIIQKWLGSHRPAVTLVPVSALAFPGWLFEIDAVASRNSIASTSIARPLSDSQKVDVVVIGAGLAGLTAAQHVIRAGYSCVVLEARDRVGGRTWSQPQASGGIIDVGAAWINDTNQSRMISLARAFGLDLIVQNTTGNIVLEDSDRSLKHFPYGELPSFDANMKAHLGQIRDTVEAECQTLSVTSTSDARSAELDSITFEEYLRQLGANEKALATGTIWTRAMLGQDAADVSALFFLHYCKAGGGLMQMRSDCKDGGQYLRIRQGTQAFSINIAKSLPADTIQYNSPASSIDQQGEQDLLVSCQATGHSYRARKVLSAIPPPTLKKIKFSPALPPAKQLLFESCRYGYYQKVMVVFKTPFWTAKNSCGLVQSFNGPAAVIRDTSAPADGKHVLTCFVAGSVGLAWSQMPTEQDRKEVILKQIGDCFDDHELVRAEYIEMVGLQWNDEEWSGYGCPASSTAPGVLSAVGECLKDRVGDVHFAGTETSDVWRGYMEGAVRSGDREAKLILADLRGVTAKI